uniref:Protein preY, mitochondrial n=1 Tax=Canis lupus familiaris TaxID=9615 RepID=A0A8C0SQR4_CANLF
MPPIQALALSVIGKRGEQPLEPRGYGPRRNYRAVGGKKQSRQQRPRNPRAASCPPARDRIPAAPGAGPGGRRGRLRGERLKRRKRLKRPGAGRAAGAGCQTMLSGACGRLASALRGPRGPSFAVARRRLHASGSRRPSDKSERTGGPPRAFDPALLEFLVCPLSKKPLRYEASTNELINEELGIAYPIIDGIPNMIPQAARMTHQNKKQEETEQH